MKRKSVTALAMILVLVTLIACNNESVQGTTGLVRVNLMTAAKTRGLEVDVPLEDMGDEGLSWYYSAAVEGDAPFKYGETERSSIELLDDGSRFSEISLSQGRWNFTLWAERDGVVIYRGETTSPVLIKSSNTTIDIQILISSLVSGVKGKIYFDKDLRIVTACDESKGETSSELPVNVIKIGEVSYNAGDEVELEAGSYEVTVAYEESVTFEGKEYTITYAKQNIIATVHSGRVTTVKGFIEEETANATFEIEFAAVYSTTDGAPYCLALLEDGSAVFAKSSPTLGAELILLDCSYSNLISDDLIEDDNGGVVYSWSVKHTSDYGCTHTIGQRGGYGTKLEPFNIISLDQFNDIDMNTNVYYYYKWAGSSEVDATGYDLYESYLHGSFDGNGVVIKNLEHALFRRIGNITGSDDQIYVIKNITVYANISTCETTAAIVEAVYVNDIVFKNVNVHGYIIGSEAASFVAWGPHEMMGISGECSIKFVNCTSDASIASTVKSEPAAGFVLIPEITYDSDYPLTLTLVNSKYSGHMSAADTNNLYYLTGSAFNGTAKDYSNNDGKVYSIQSDPTEWKYIAAGRTHTLEEEIVYLSETAMAIGDCFTVEKGSTNAVKAIFSLIVTAHDENGDVRIIGTVLDEIVDADGSSFTSSLVKYFQVRVNPEASTYAEVVNGNYYDIIDSDLDSLYSNTLVNVALCDSNGGILKVITYDFCDVSQPSSV